ncbi:hypothetical protein HRbin27_00382 [bacterium HR27]|nr:hypothetical protein HRbin27_00382 [bacterium HR27]
MAATGLLEEPAIERRVVRHGTATVSQDAEQLTIDQRPLGCAGEDRLGEPVNAGCTGIDRTSRTHERVEEDTPVRVEYCKLDHLVAGTDTGRFGIENHDAGSRNDPPCPLACLPLSAHDAHCSVNCSPGWSTMHRALVCAMTACAKATGSCSINGNVL